MQGGPSTRAGAPYYSQKSKNYFILEKQRTRQRVFQYPLASAGLIARPGDHAARSQRMVQDFLETFCKLEALKARPLALALTLDVVLARQCRARLRPMALPLGLPLALGGMFLA